MADFIEAKFQYLATFELFEWIPYLTTQHPIHKNLFGVLFSNAILKNAGKKEEDSCRIVVINTFVMSMPIRITQKDVATVFDMLDEGLSDEHAGYPPSMLVPNVNALNLPLHDKLLQLFVSHFFRSVRLKYTMVRQIDYQFMYQVQAGNKINLSP